MFLSSLKAFEAKWQIHVINDTNLHPCYRTLAAFMDRLSLLSLPCFGLMPGLSHPLNAVSVNKGHQKAWPVQMKNGGWKGRGGGQKRPVPSTEQRGLRWQQAG